MSIGEIARLLLDFFFGEYPALPLAFVRIGLGAILLLDALVYIRHRKTWLDPSGVPPMKEITAVDKLPRGGFLLFLFRTTTSTTLVLYAHCLAAILLLTGFGGHLTSAFVFFTTLAVHGRNRFVLYGGDSAVRICLSVLVFSDCTAALSVDALIASGAVVSGATIQAWPIRLLQVFLCVIYFQSAAHKWKFTSWRDGSAMYYVLANEAFQRGSRSRWLRNRTLLRLASWGTLFVEYAFTVLVLFDETRLAAIVMMFGFHAGVAVLMPLMFFSYIMMVLLLVFLPVSVPSGGVYGGDIETFALMPVLLFIAIQVAWDSPAQGPLHFLSRRLTRLVVGLGLDPNWKLFAADPPCPGWGLVRILAHHQDESVSAYDWDARRGLTTARSGVRVRRMIHRQRKFEESLLAFVPLRRMFLIHLLPSLSPVRRVALLRVGVQPADPSTGLTPPTKTEVLAMEQLSPSHDCRTREERLMGHLANTVFAYNLIGDRAAKETLEFALIAYWILHELGCDTKEAAARVSLAISVSDEEVVRECAVRASRLLRVVTGQSPRVVEDIEELRGSVRWEGADHDVWELSAISGPASNSAFDGARASSRASFSG